MDGIEDCYTLGRGFPATPGDFAKAAFDAVAKTCCCLTPDLWKETLFTNSPCQEFAGHLVETHTPCRGRRLYVATT